MNIEDRLKEAFAQEAEHLHAPHGSPEHAIRRGRRRRASNLIGGAALVLTLIGGTAAGVQLLGDTDQPDRGDPAATATSRQSNEQSTSGRSDAPEVDFVWERFTLPTTATTNVWNLQVTWRTDRFIAAGIGFDEMEGFGEPGQQLLVWESVDGANWSSVSVATPLDGAVDTLLSTGEGFVAVVRGFEGSGDVTRLYTSIDGRTWTEGAADLGSLTDNQYIWFGGAAGGNGVTVLAGVLQTEPPQPPVILEDAGVVLQQNMGDGGFTVSNLATGEVITTIDNEIVFGSGSGITVRNADDAVILVVFWDELDEARALGEAEDGSLLIDKDGIRLELDYEEYTYVATDIATNTVVASGIQDDLYRSPRVHVTHPESGETILDIGIEEFDAAMEDAWSSYEYRPQTDFVLLTTSDGVTWDRTDLEPGPGEEFNVGGVGFGSDGFLVSLNRYGPDSFGTEVWRSRDGHDWEVVSSTDTPGDGPIAGRGDDYFRISLGRRSGVERSADGVDWTMVHEAPDAGTFYSWMAAGDLGIVAVGQNQEDVFGPPVVVRKEGRTLVIDGRTGRMTVTEDDSGEVLTTIELDVYEEEPPEQIRYDAAAKTITITDVDGTVLMTMTEDEANAASTEAETGYEYPVPEPSIAFSSDGDEWFTTTTVGLDLAWAQGAAVGADAVVIVGESAASIVESQSGTEASVTVQLGDGSLPEVTTVPAEPYGLSPQTFIWVGRPR